MKQTRTTLKELTARYRAVVLKCVLINLMFCSAAGAASITDAEDATNRYIGSFGLPLRLYDHENGAGTFYAVSTDLMGDAAISGVTATLNNASLVGSGNLSWTQSTQKYAEVSSVLSSGQITGSIDNIAAVLTTMNNGAKDYDALSSGIKQALNVPFDGGRSIAEYLQDTWPGSTADISAVRTALNSAYETFNSNMTTLAAWDKAVSITGSTLTLNGTSSIVNRSKYTPASAGGISVVNSTVTANGNNALTAHTDIAFTGSSHLKVNQGATLTVTSAGDRVSLTNSSLTLNGAIAGNVSLSGTAALKGTGSVSHNLNVADASVLNMQNGAVDSITAGTVTGGNFSVALDVNAVGGAIDRFTANSFTTGTVTISGLNFLSAQKSFTLTVLNGTTTNATLVLSDAVSNAYNGQATVSETVDDLSATANWGTAFTRTVYTLGVTRSLGVQDNKKLVFTVVENSRTPSSVSSLGDTMRLLNTMDEAARTMTNATSAASYTVTENLGTTAAGTFTLNGAKSNSSVSTVNMNAHTGFSVADGATLNLRYVTFDGNTADAGSVLTVAGGAADLLKVIIPNTVSVTSGTLTLSGMNLLGGLNNAGTVVLTGANGVGAISGAGTLTNNGNMTLTGTTNGQIIGGTGRTYINNALTTTAAINQAITINANRSLTANADDVGGAVTNKGLLSLTGGTLGRVVTGGTVHIDGNVTSNVSLSNTTITTGNRLTISAGNIGDNLANNGTLALSGGTLTRAVSGTVHIDGTVMSNVALSNATVNATKQLTIGAGNVGTGLTNNGTLVLSGGTLGNALSGTGNVYIDGVVVSNVDLARVTINSGKKLTINAGYADNTFTNNGTLALSGGTLNAAVAGTVHIDGNVTSNVALSNTTVNATKQLTIAANNVGTGLANNGTLVLTGGTLGNALSGAGTVRINGDVTSNVSLSNTTITTGNRLTISAGNIGNNLTNNGILALSGGTLNTLAAGTVHIDGTVTSNVLMSNTTINASKQLTIAANNVGTGLTNNGTLVLTGGTLRRGIAGAGAVRIDGDVVSDVDLARVTINSGKKLTINAGYADATFTNNGILALSGGTLNTAVSGTGTIQIDGTVTSNVALSNATINGGKRLTIAANNVGAGLTNNGVLALSGGTLNAAVAGTVQITGDVTSNVDLANVTVNAGKKLTINAGYVDNTFTNNGTLALSGGTLNAAVAGTVQVVGDVTSNVSLSNTTITTGNRLTISAGNIGNNLANNGTLALSGGTLTRAVSGTVQIDGTVTSNVALSNATVNATKQLTIGAGNVGTGLTNNGTLVLTGGTLGNALSGTGNVYIDGAVVSDVDLARVTINSGKKLTINAGYVDNTFTNNGILALSGGTLNAAVAGTVHIDGNVTSNVALSNAMVNGGKRLTIAANNVGANLTNNGILSLSGGTLSNVVSGTVYIDGDVISNVALANTKINGEKRLTIAADDVGTGLTNNGTLVLTGGTLANALSGNGSIGIDGDVTSNVDLARVTINSGKKLTINAGYADGTFTNNGILALSGGTLNTVVSGTGTIQIAGDVASNVALSNATVNAAKQLTIAANNVGTGLTNNGTLVLTGGTLGNALSGAGTVRINGDVTSNVDLANVTVNAGKKLTINAGYADGTFTNNGVLALSGGTLNAAVAGTGTIQIAGDVTSDVALSNTTVNGGKKLTIAANNVGAGLTNNGTLVLTDGTLSNVLSGAGAVRIDGTVTSDVALSNTTVNGGKRLTIGADNVGTGMANDGTVVLTDGTLRNALSGAGAVRIAGNVLSEKPLSNVTVEGGKTLTLSAGNVGAEFTNNGTVVLTGGNISKPLSGNVAVTGYVGMDAGADFNGADLDMTEGILDIGENALRSDTLNGGMVWADLKEYAAAETLITTTPSDTVTLAVFPFNVTNKAVQHYTLTSTDNGYSLEFALPSFYAVSKTPFDKSEAMTIGEFDETSWHGGDLYVVALNVAEVAVSELTKNGYEVTNDMKNTTKKLSDDLEDILTGPYQGNYQKVSEELIYGFFYEDYGRVKTILNETGTEVTPATSQTVQTNAQAVMSVVSSRMGGASAVKGRSGGDLIAGDFAVWAQGMFNKAKLSGRNGFDSDSTGFAAGFEYNIDDSYKAGIGYAFASTEIKTDRSKTDVDTHTVFAYGQYKPDAFYINGTLSYGRSEYDEKTKSLGLQSGYKAETLSVQAMAGYVFDLFAPEAGLRSVNVDEKSYTDALGARVGGGTSQTLTAVAGVNASKDFRLEKGTLSAQAKAALTYDLKQGGLNKTVSLANGTGYVVRGENMKRFGMEFGAGVSYRLNENTDVGVVYEGKFKSRYADHTAILNVRYGF